MFSYEIKIPKERIAVLIGKKGEIKKQIEENTNTKLEIDSKEGDVIVSGEDAILLYSARNIIRAIGRGFNPELAMLLLKQDYSFEIINLPDFENPNQLKRIRGRVIGKEGRTREIIEEMTECYVSVYGKTIGIIGTIESVINAKRAIEMLIKGSPHANVYKWLEKRRREQKKRELEEFYIKRDNIDI
ncbi:MAG: KH domain-containing protein [Candidatus Woesearchaeota archaeon]